MADGNALTYEQARDMAQSGDVDTRAALAARADVMPEILYFLSSDAAPQVRSAIAANPSTPSQAHVTLAKDADDGVRTSLVEKISRLAPGLSPDEQDKVHKLTRETLEILAHDQMVQVRQVLAEALKDVAHAPADVIRRLSRDEELVVCGPVLEFSPVLTDDDLLEIIQSGTASGGLGAIARRSSVSEGVSDAIAETDDVDAIADLIANPSAQIREETLDSLVERAEGVDLWHAPLVARPALSSGAASRLALFVADNLLEVMQSREDLDADVMAQVRDMVHSRLGGAEVQGAGLSDTLGGNADIGQITPPLDLVRNLASAGKLDLAVISKALQASDVPFVLASICVLAEVSPDVAKAVLKSRNGKGVMALAWKAGFPAAMGVHLQQRLARISPTDVVQTTPEGSYPLADDDMEWQLEYFTDLTEKQRV